MNEIYMMQIGVPGRWSCVKFYWHLPVDFCKPQKYNFKRGMILSMIRQGNHRQMNLLRCFW